MHCKKYGDGLYDGRPLKIDRLTYMDRISLIGKVEIKIEKYAV